MYIIRSPVLESISSKHIACSIYSQTTAIMVAYSLLLLVALRLLSVSASTSSTPDLCEASLPESALPRPPLNSNARLIYLGIGTQNYSCTGSTPSSRGAVASLIDITSLYCPRQHASGGLVERSRFEEAGHHYFTSALVPTFNITKAWMPFVFSASKAANVSSPGTSIIPKIDWLYLVPDSLAPNSGRVRAVYRIKTVGGVSTTPCIGDQEVPYMAEYWFFF